MNVVALLSWYDEDPAWLAETTASLSKLCDHVVAMDGAYALFPDALRKPTSEPGQGEVIARTARGCGMAATIHTPSGPWWGNEVEKRDRMLELGMAVADAGDWFLSIDADEVLATAPSGVRDDLHETDKNVAQVTFWEREYGKYPIRRLFRAQFGMRISGAHYRVVVGDRVLVDHGGVEEPALNLPDVVLEHRGGLRSESRRRQKAQYNADRDQLGVEAVGA
jgi:hypothetical protein